MAVLRSFRRGESGQGTTEYALIVGLVSLTLLLFLVAFRGQVGQVYRMVRLELMENATEQVELAGDPDVDTPAGAKGKPGRGQGQGCPSVGGCKPGKGRK